MKSLNDFYEGLRSIGPVGLWLPWSEVVELAGRCGWSGQDCGVAANICCGLQAVELDPRDGDERPAGPSPSKPRTRKNTNFRVNAKSHVSVSDITKTSLCAVFSAFQPPKKEDPK